MNQLTLRQIPKTLEREIRRRAESTGESINTTVIRLLAKALGLPEAGDKKRDLSRFAGTWTREDVEEFENSTAVFENIDDDLWRRP